jgi:hypothetical protein
VAASRSWLVDSHQPTTASAERRRDVPSVVRAQDQSRKIDNEVNRDEPGVAPIHGLIMIAGLRSFGNPESQRICRDCARCLIAAGLRM